LDILLDDAAVLQFFLVGDRTLLSCTWANSCIDILSALDRTSIVFEFFAQVDCLSSIDDVIFVDKAELRELALEALLRVDKAAVVPGHLFFIAVLLKMHLQICSG
jgi:hypothetical protein